MARIRAVASTDGEVAITGGAGFKTLLAVLPASNHLIAIKGFSISFDGTTVTDAPVLVKVTQSSGANPVGTGGSTVTLYEETLHGLDLTVHASAVKSPTGEPSSFAKTYRVYNVHPQTGIEVRFTPDDEILLKSNSNAFCILASSSAGVDPNATVHVSFEA